MKNKLISSTPVVKNKRTGTYSCIAHIRKDNRTVSERVEGESKTAVIEKLIAME